MHACVCVTSMYTRVATWACMRPTQAKREPLAAVVARLADAVESRSAKGKNFGMVLIPEGLVEYIPEV